MFTLYATPLSANARKPLALVAHLGLSPTIEQVNVYRGEGLDPAFRAISPLGKVPALVEGSLTLTESNAILQYIDEAHGGGRLGSLDPAVRADIARWMFWEAAHFQPELTPVLTPAVAHGLGHAPAPTDAPAWDAARLVPQLALLDRHLADRRFLVDDRLTVADFAVAGMTTYFDYAGFPYARYPGIAAFCQRMQALDAWRATAVAPWSGAATP